MKIKDELSRNLQKPKVSTKIHILPIFYIDLTEHLPKIITLKLSLPDFKKYLSLFVILSLFTAEIFASPTIGITPIPSWILPVLPAGKAPSSKEFSEGYYVSFTDMQVHLDKKTTFHHLIRQIASESGIQNGSEISLVFDPSYEHVDFHKITIWRNGKAVSQVKASDFKVIPVETDRQRFIYNGYYSASVILKDVRKGDRIEYSYSITGWNPVFKNIYSNTFSFGVYDYISHMHYAIVSDNNRSLYFKEFNKPPAKITRKVNNLTSYEWDLKNIKNLRYEDYVPAWFNNQPFVQITEYKNWKEVVDWGLNFYQTPALTSPLKSKVEEWKKLANSRLAYMELAVRFVQDEIRYLGIETGENSHRPHSPDEVFRQRYGDCKDKAFLLCALLKANDIDADPLLVDTYKKSHISEYLPTPANFNHVVVRARIRNEGPGLNDENAFVYIDATYSLQGGAISQLFFPAYGAGLLLKSGQDEIITIPLQNSRDVSVEEEITLPSQKDTTAMGTLIAKTVYFQGEADNLRSQFQQNNLSETEESYLNYYRTNYKNAEFEMMDTLEYYDQREANNFSLIERYSMKNAWQFDSTRQKYVFTILGKILYDQLLNLPNRPRKDPVSLKFPYHMRYTIKIRMPGPWNVPNDNWEIKRDAYVISFKSEFMAAENVWQLYYDYETLKDHVPASESNQLRKDIEKLVTNLEYELSNPDSNRINTADLNYGMIGFFIIMLIAGIMFCLKLYKYTPEYAIQSNYGISIGGWLVVVGIGLIAKPFMILFTILGDSYSVYFTNTGWNVFLGQSDLKVMSYHLAILFEVVFNIFLFSVSILLIVLFLKKRNSFPYLFSMVTGINLIFIIADTAVSQALLGSNAVNAESFNDIFKQFISAAIWIPYMYKSQRVKDTFVKNYEENLVTDDVTVQTLE